MIAREGGASGRAMSRRTQQRLTVRHQLGHPVRTDVASIAPRHRHCQSGCRGQARPHSGGRIVCGVRAWHSSPVSPRD